MTTKRLVKRTDANQQKMIMKAKDRLNGSETLKPLLTLMTGSGIAVLIPLLATPILTRIYTSQQFGLLGLFVSAVSIGGSLATFSYEASIMLPKSKKGSLNLALIAIICSVAIVFLMLFFEWLFSADFIFQSFNISELSDYAFLLVLCILGTALTRVFTYALNRNKNYGILSLSKVIGAVADVGIKLSIVFSKEAYILFLLIGHVVGQLLQSVLMGYFFVTRILNKQRIKPRNLKILACRYKKFPLITMPHNLLSILSKELPTILVASFFSIEMAGFYFLAQRITSAPISILADSHYRVFFAAFSDSNNKIYFYKKHFIHTNIILVPCFATAWFFLPFLFGIIFGESWQQAGHFAQIILPLLYLKFLSNSFTSVVYLYFERQIENLFLGAVITLSVLLSFHYAKTFNDLEVGLWLMALSNSIIILIKLARAYSFVKKGKCNAGRL